MGGFGDREKGVHKRLEPDFLLGEQLLNEDSVFTARPANGGEPQSSVPPAPSSSQRSSAPVPEYSGTPGIAACASGFLSRSAMTLPPEMEMISPKTFAWPELPHSMYDFRLGVVL